jgi:hypothetical protein
MSFVLGAGSRRGWKSIEPGRIIRQDFLARRIQMALFMHVIVVADVARHLIGAA